eukprot:s1156_g33.t1
MESPRASWTRCQLTCRNVRKDPQKEGPSLETADGVSAKKDSGAKQEMKRESPVRGRMEIDELWLQVKKEIKEEMAKDMTSTNFESDILMQGVMMKEEVEMDVEGSLQSQPDQSTDLIEERTGQPLQVAKRRRLTGEDMQKISKTEGLRCPSSVKKELADGVKVKKESLERSARDMSELGDSAKSECQDLIDADESSLDAFASQAAAWAKQCLAFRSSKTWSPNRPCCPANVFLSSASGTPSPPQPDAPACVLRLTGHGLRCLQRFYNKQSLHSMVLQSQVEASQTCPQTVPPKPLSDCHLQMQDYKVCGLDGMKRWPWMRDLPTSVWAGRGWALDENGLRRLSSAGGTHAMQGVEVFESVGAAAAEVKPSDEAPHAVAAAEHPSPSSGEQEPARFMRSNIAKQSGIPNIRWNILCAWEVNFPKVDSRGMRNGRTNRKFSVRNFMGPGISEAQADAAALEAAKAFRAELVEKGLLSEPKLRDPNFTSEVPGVAWDKTSGKWRVRVRSKGGQKVIQDIQGGCFTEKAAAEAKALWLMEKAGLQRRLKPVATLSELAVFHPKVPYPRVNWNQAEQQWHAKCDVGGSTRHLRVRPKDHSEAELERSFQVAVAWRKKQEKEGKAVKPKAKLGKKQRD